MEINQISLKKALQQTGSVFIRNIGKIIIFALLVYLPIAIIQVFFLNSNTLEEFYTLLESVQAGTAEETALLAYRGKMLAYLGGMALIGLFSLLYTAAVTKITACTIYKNKITGMDIFDNSIRLFPKMLLTQLLCGLFVFMGFMLCFIPGIAFAVVFSQAMSLVVLTGMWKLQAMKLSEKLVRRHMLLFVMILLLNMAFSFLLQYLFGWLSEGLFLLTGLTGIAADVVVVAIYILQQVLGALAIIFSTTMLLQVINRNSDLEIKLIDVVHEV